MGTAEFLSNVSPVERYYNQKFLWVSRCLKSTNLIAREEGKEEGVRRSRFREIGVRNKSQTY